ncbi:MAG: galactose-1-phosphate uridylyltransferase [Acidimicrobiales bacterium]
MSYTASRLVETDKPAAIIGTWATILPILSFPIRRSPTPPVALWQGVEQRPGTKRCGAQGRSLRVRNACCDSLPDRHIHDSGPVTTQSQRIATFGVTDCARQPTAPDIAQEATATDRNQQGDVETNRFDPDLLSHGTQLQHGNQSHHMNQLRLDPLTGRWVVVSTDRANRPMAFSPMVTTPADTTRPCPFCPGNEEATPPALETYGPEGHWLVRVVPNLYPAFEGNDPFVVTNRGPVFTQATAGGIHEVLILSPDHDKKWSMLDDEQTNLVMVAIRDRVEEHSRVPGLRYSQAIINSGRKAGASVEHPHGQLLGMSFVPRELVEEQAGFARFAGRCLLCTSVDAEEDFGHRVVYADKRVLVICPFWSGAPYEMMIIPRTHCPHLHHSVPDDLKAVGKALKEALDSLHELLGDVAYHVVFHSAPYRAAEPYHWHVHVVPKLTTVAGFELGTGVLINIKNPEQAAGELKVRVAVAGNF